MMDAPESSSGMALVEPQRFKPQAGFLGALVARFRRILGSPTDARIADRQLEDIDTELPDNPDVIIAPGGYVIRRTKESQDTNSLDRLLPEVREGLDLLPPLPSVVVDLLREIQSSTSSAASVAQIAANDPSLAASLLRTVNSSAFGMTNKVTSVPQAVSYLGFGNVRSLVVRLRLESILPPRNAGLAAEAEDLWAHSLAVSYIAEALAEKMSDVDRGFIATLGLMHDIGRLAIISQFPLNVASLRLTPLREGETPLQREARIFGADHAAIGALLGNRWQLPADLTLGIRWHHDPAHAFQPGDPLALRKAIYLVQIADQLAKFCLAYSEEMQIDAPADGGMQLLGFDGELPKRLDAKVRAAATQAILLADENSNRAADSIRPFLCIRRGDMAAAMAQRLAHIPADTPRIEVGEGPDHFIDSARQIIRMGSDACRQLSDQSAVARFIIPATAEGIKFVVGGLTEYWALRSISPRISGPHRTMLRAVLANLVADTQKSAQDNIDVATLWDGVELQVAVRSGQLAYESRLPQNADLILCRRILETELANILNLAWFKIEAATDGSAILFKSA